MACEVDICNRRQVLRCEVNVLSEPHILRCSEPHILRYSFFCSFKPQGCAFYVISMSCSLRCGLRTKPQSLLECGYTQ